MKILYIHHAGDFCEAYERLIQKNGAENYYGQKYTVEAVVEQARKGHSIMILVLNATEHFIELEKNLLSVGLGEKAQKETAIQSYITSFSPERVILRTPNVKILRFLRKNKFNTFPVLADSFENIPWYRIRSFTTKFLLAFELKKTAIKWVANHQINASLSVKKLGVEPSKILPYDWVHPDNPTNWNKEIRDDFQRKEIELFFAGMISPAKGIWDLIKAASYLKEFDRNFAIKIAGRGDTDGLLQYAKELGVDKNIQLLGLISHDDVLKNMNKADLVIVPSHHSYPEGLPMTIMESLMVHTPVVASNHPMFVGRVGSKGSVTFFKEQDAKDLAKKILTICADKNLYKNMSFNASDEWEELNLELKWSYMINEWISNLNTDFSMHSLNNYL
jgi:glycosyltransferase involved in cell wall biosynthesis